MVSINVSLSDIIKYLGDKIRPLTEGEAVLNAGHIILCGLVSNSNKHVKSLCLQTSALKSEPHEININLFDEVNLWKCCCSCKAGLSGFCKHVVATLLFINRNEVELLSCTDLTQSWGKRKKSLGDLHNKIRSDEFWCHKPKKEKLEVSDIVNTRNFNRLVLCSTTSAIYKFLEKSNETIINNVPSDNTPPPSDPLFSILVHANSSPFLSTLKLEVGKLKDCCKLIVEKLGQFDQQKLAFNCNQKSDQWLEARKIRITGSRCYKLFTYSKNDWEKFSHEYFFPRNLNVPSVQHGIKFEAEAFNCYKSCTNFQIINLGLIVCKRFPWLAFSPDGLVIENEKPSILVEIKCPFRGINTSAEDLVKTCDYLQETKGQIVLKKRHFIYGQVQFGMALLNVSKTHLVIYSPYSKSLVMVVVEFDNEFTTNLLNTVTNKFLYKMIHTLCNKK